MAEITTMTAANHGCLNPLRQRQLRCSNGAVKEMASLKHVHWS
ncbi:hypothetical protein ACFYZJ_35340 [Streptomyces sp. NPDC001848]